MKSAKNLLDKAMNSFRVLSLSHKIFLFLVLFNILAWSDAFEPEPLKVTATSESSKLVCATAQWDKKNLGDEYLVVSGFNFIGTQPNVQTLASKIKKLDSVAGSIHAKDHFFRKSKTQYFVFHFPNNNKLRGFSLRGPPIV